MQTYRIHARNYKPYQITGAIALGIIVLAIAAWALTTNWSAIKAAVTGQDVDPYLAEVTAVIPPSPAGMSGVATTSAETSVSTSTSGTASSDANNSSSGATTIVTNSYSSISSSVSASANSSSNTITIPPTAGLYYVFVAPDSYHKVPGSTVVFKGSHFSPGEQVSIYSEGTQVGTVTANSSGAFTTSAMPVPYSW